jgi:hypothetical protein
MLYENQCIAQFLALLGHTLGTKNLSLTMSMNLFQQTRLDPGLTDLQIGPSERLVMIEFKRSGNNDSEFKKRGLRGGVVARVANLRMQYKYLKNFREISVRSHWAGQCCVDPAGIPDAKFISYLDFLVPGLEKVYGPNLYQPYPSMQAFVDGLFDPKDNFLGVTQAEFNLYLNYLFTSAPSKYTSAAGSDLLLLVVTPAGVTWALTTVGAYLSPSVRNSR